MNAERLNAVLLALKAEYDSQDIDRKLQSVVEKLEQVVNSNHSSYQQELANALKLFRTSTNNAKSDLFSPMWRQILVEIGAEPLIGQALREHVDGILETNSITPAVALEEIRKIHSRVKSLRQAINQGADSFKYLGIGSERLNPGECEIGVLVPRSAIENRLLNFAAELKEIDFIVNTFTEIATGQREQIALKTVSSSDLLVYLSSNLPSAACIAVAVERVVALYKQLLEVRKLHGELRKQGVPAESIKGIESHANEIMSKGIEQLSVEIVAKYYHKKDGGRKNELITAAKVSLNKLANRIDRGFNVEVRVEQLAEGSAESKNEEKNQAVHTIFAASANMKFLKVDGPPILQLPESTEKPKKHE